jgi:predicted Zn-dependent protease
MSAEKVTRDKAPEGSAMKKSGIVGIFLMAGLLALAPSALAGGDKTDVNDIGNRKVAHKSIISQEKEIAIGRQYATEVEKQSKIIKDPVVAEYVNRIAQNIARNSDLTIPLTVRVIDSPEINAFALPGGFLFVNSGVVLAADEEDQMAGVIAHEIAHVAARHWASQMTKATLLQYATIPLIFIPMTYPVYMGISSAMNFGIPMAFLKFDRNAEAEADFLGLQYMYKAGYDPNGYVTFFSKVIEAERRQPGSVPKIFQDHPPTPERILKCEQEIKEMLPKREQYLVSTSEFNDVKARLKTVVASLKKDEKPGPTLRKRAPDESTPAGEGKDASQDDDKPPVLKRRD